MSLPVRHKPKQSRLSWLLSLAFHILLVGGLFYFAARQGILGKQMRTLTAVAVPEDKKPEVQKPKEEVKPTAERREEARVDPRVAPQQATGNSATPPPAAADATVSAAAPAEPTDMVFDDGAARVKTVTDPIALFSGRVEYAFLSRWDKPEDLDDSQFVAEADVTLKADGTVAAAELRRPSGNPKWDDSVRNALGSVKAVGAAPPAGYPTKFLVKFDATIAASEPVQ